MDLIHILHLHKLNILVICCMEVIVTVSSLFLAEIATIGLLDLHLHLFAISRSMVLIFMYLHYITEEIISCISVL